MRKGLFLRSMNQIKISQREKNNYVSVLTRSIADFCAVHFDAKRVRWRRLQFDLLRFVGPRCYVHTLSVRRKHMVVEVFAHLEFRLISRGSF